MDFRRALLGKGEFELVEEELEVFFGLGVAGHDDLASVGGGKVDVDHLHGGELFQHGSRCEPAGGAAEPGFERHLQAVGEERDGRRALRFDVRVDDGWGAGRGRL